MLSILNYRMKTRTKLKKELVLLQLDEYLSIIHIEDNLFCN